MDHHNSTGYDSPMIYDITAKGSIICGGRKINGFPSLVKRSKYLLGENFPYYFLDQQTARSISKKHAAFTHTDTKALWGVHTFL